jgi:hypothetical protein
MRFPMKRVGIECRYGMVGHLGGVSVRREPPDDSSGEVSKAVFSGVDRGGSAWLVEIFVSAHGCSLWQADLDGNGQQDLILHDYLRGNGLAPSSGLQILLFDEKRRPVPWSPRGYFHEDSLGIQDLVDLNRDGRAELVQMEFDDGYWITTLYEAKAAFWRRIDGQHGKRTFPVFTRFTSRPNHTAVIPAKNRHPRAKDWSNDSTAAPSRGTILRLEEGRDVYAYPNYFLSDGRDCRHHGWPNVIVDRPNRREIAMAGEYSRYALVLLREISGRKLPVRVTDPKAERCFPGGDRDWFGGNLWADDDGRPKNKGH